MNKVYCLINTNGGFNIAASKTRRALEEKMCDMFMEDYQKEMQEAADTHWINVENPTDDCRQYARDTWNMLINYYKNYYDIERVEMI